MNLLKFVNSLKLRTKFGIPISVLLVASIVVITSYLIDRQADGYRRELETSGETMIAILANNAESGVIFESTYELDEILQLLSQFEVVEYACITNKEDIILSEIGQALQGYEQTKPLYHDASDDEGHHDFFIRNEYGQEFIELSNPIVTRIQNLGRENLGITGGLDNSFKQSYVTEEIGRIKLVLNLETVNQSIAESRRTAILIAVVVLLITIIMLTFFVRFITKPVKMLVDITDQVSRGDLTQKVELDQNDEIGHLARTFNRMIESLKHSRDEIEEYNRNLEQKIVERTLELEEIQAQLVQSEKLSAIGQLAAGVAHELNNPLGGILGYAQFALEKLNKSQTAEETARDKGKYIRYLTDIEVQARRCKTIVQNLLRFSRSSKTTDFSYVDINQVIGDTITFVEHQLHMNQIQLKMELHKNLPTIQGDTGQLQQVLTNLILNAMHASPPDTEIQVISRFSPALGEFGGTVEILIIDQGSGISHENVKKIFEPFFTTKQVGKGTGLGLSVSYGIVKDHGGEIKVESKSGEGSTFIVILPVQKPQPASDNVSNELQTKN